MAQKWKDLPGFRNRYRISNAGKFCHKKIEVPSLVVPGKKRTWSNRKNLKRKLNRNGYLEVRLDGKYYTVKELVADNWLRPRHPGFPVILIDGNPWNCHVDNLKEVWYTRYKGRQKFFAVEIIAIRHLYGNVSGLRGSLATLARRFDTTRQAIELIVHRKRWNKWSILKKELSPSQMIQWWNGI